MILCRGNTAQTQLYTSINKDHASTNQKNNFIIPVFHIHNVAIDHSVPHIPQFCKLHITSKQTKILITLTGFYDQFVFWTGLEKVSKFLSPRWQERDESKDDEVRRQQTGSVHSQASKNVIAWHTSDRSEEGESGSCHLFRLGILIYTLYIYNIIRTYMIYYYISIIIGFRVLNLIRNVYVALRMLFKHRTGKPKITKSTPLVANCGVPLTKSFRRLGKILPRPHEVLPRFFRFQNLAEISARSWRDLWKILPRFCLGNGKFSQRFLQKILAKILARFFLWRYNYYAFSAPLRLHSTRFWRGVFVAYIYVHQVAILYISSYLAFSSLPVHVFSLWRYEGLNYVAIQCHSRISWLTRSIV